MLAAALLGACAGPATQVILLPQPDGRPSGVVVRAAGGVYVITQPFERATITAGSSKAPLIDRSDLAQVQAAHPELFALMPPKPEHFVLYFDAGGTVLTSESRQTIETVLTAARKRSGSDLLVTGHTDTMGTATINDALSLRRAGAVRQMFAAREFPAHRIEAVGRGMRDPAIATAPEIDEPRNRRVTVDLR